MADQNQLDLKRYQALFNQTAAGPAKDMYAAAIQQIQQRINDPHDWAGIAARQAQQAQQPVAAAGGDPTDPMGWKKIAADQQAALVGGPPINAFQEPAKQSQPAVELQRLAEIGYREKEARDDSGLASSRLTDNYQKNVMPQLQGGLGARGQFHGTAGDKAMQGAAQSFTNSNADIESGLQRKLADFTRQRTYSSIGVLI